MEGRGYPGKEAMVPYASLDAYNYSIQSACEVALAGALEELVSTSIARSVEAGR
jgi:hypothetical protein